MVIALFVVGSLGVGYLAGGQMDARTTTSTSLISTTAAIAVSSQPTSQGESTTQLTSTCYSGLLQNSSSPTIYTINVTGQFNSWLWNGTLGDVAGYQVNALAYSNTASKVYLEPQVFLLVSNGQETEIASYTNLGAWNGQTWPPDFSQSPVSLFNGNVTLQWFFTCKMTVFLQITVA